MLARCPAVARVLISGVGCLAIAALGTLWSPWAIVSAAALVALLVGLATARSRRWPGLTLAACVALLTLLAARFVAADDGENLRATPLPQAGSGRVVDRLLEEQDVVLSAAPLLRPMGLIPPREGEGLTAALRREYGRMLAAEGVAPSPLASTALGLDGPDSFDVLVHDASAPLASDVAVLFLHGYGGSFALPCWEIAAAAADAGMRTACPSVGQRGDWWTSRGERIARTTIRWLRASGARRVVLAGLSNGAIGASRLAPRLRRGIDGVLLVSGASGAPPPGGLPVLVIQGDHDTMTSPVVARAYARRAGRRGTFVPLEGDHFVLVHRAVEIQARVTQWLQAFSGPRSARRG